MPKPIKVTDTDLVLDVDAVCVLYAKVFYANEDGVVTECPTPISGIFHSWPLEMPPREDENGYLSVYVWCLINEIKLDEGDEEGYWLVLKVPPHGYIELPGYTGEVISRINFTL